MVNYFSVKIWEWLEDRSFYKIFPDPKFQKIDKDLKSDYKWKNPYTISREYCQAMGEMDIHQYGETPLTTMNKIARALKLTKDDHIYEYGSGRGRSSFFLKHYFSSKVTGIEHNPVFVKRAQNLAKKHQIDIDFQEKDFRDVDPSDATVIYLYGTCLPDKVIYHLCDKFPKEAKIVTISYALCEYDRRFRVTQKLRVRFPWGDTDAYINQISRQTS